MPHVVFGVCLMVPGIWLLVMKKAMAVKKEFAMLLVASTVHGTLEPRNSGTLELQRQQDVA
jgi:hypothetical protein